MTQKLTRACPSPFPPVLPHQSVLAAEVLAILEPVPDGVYVDATFGDGGHSRALLQHLGPHGRVIAMDRDREAINRNQTLLQTYPEQLTVIQTPFSRLQEVLVAHNITTVHGVLFDLGVSSRQLDEPERGFSFQTDGPLDMRMDQFVAGGATPAPLWSPPTPQPTAATIVNTFGQEALADIFFHFGEERHARRIARAIVMDRQQQPFTTTRQLATLLERIIPNSAGKRSSRGHGIHPATRVFQALRIAVNRELEELQTGLAAALRCLATGGRVAVISFHSLEDRIVKQTFRHAVDPLPPPLGPAALLQPVATPPRFRVLTRKPLLPGAAEIHQNPRARSARLRVIERLSTPQESVL